MYVIVDTPQEAYFIRILGDDSNHAIQSQSYRSIFSIDNWEVRTQALSLLQF